MDCSTPGFPVNHQLLELAQTHVHRVGDAIQSSHPLSSPSPPALNLSQHLGLFQWVSSSHQVAKVLELQLLSDLTNSKRVKSQQLDVVWGDFVNNYFKIWVAEYFRREFGDFSGVPMVKLYALNAGGVGSIPGWGTKIPNDLWHSQKKKKETFLWTFKYFFCFF